MVSKVRFISLLLLTGIFLFSCSKHNDVNSPTQPELLDTLGAGWQSIKIDTTLVFDDIFFVNNQKGFLCGDNYLGESTDGGLSWQRIIPDSLNEGFINLFFADADNGWVTGTNFLLRTRDGGSSWQKAHIGPAYDAQFFDANNGYITTYDGSLFKTADGGVTLQPVNNVSAHSLFFLDQNRGWAAGSYLFKTTDGGATFSTIGGAVQFQDYAMQFTDTLHGWIAGPVIYGTVDGGVTLETLASDPSAGGDIQFFDANNGYILTGNKIYSTADGGKTVNLLCTIHKSQLYEIHFTDAGHGWATGGGGYVYRYVKP